VNSRYWIIVAFLVLTISFSGCFTLPVSHQEAPPLPVKEYQKDNVNNGAYRDFVWLADEGSAYILFLKYPVNKDFGIIIDGPVAQEFLHRGPGYDVVIFIPEETAHFNIRVKAFKGSGWFRLYSVKKPLAFMDKVTSESVASFDVYLKTGDLSASLLRSAGDCTCEDFFLEVFDPDGKLIGRSDDAGCWDTFAFPVKKTGYYKIFVNTTGCGGDYIFFTTNPERINE
jgi:hypothetical protein